MVEQKKPAPTVKPERVLKVERDEDFEDAYRIDGVTYRKHVEGTPIPAGKQVWVKDGREYAFEWLDDGLIHVTPEAMMMLLRSNGFERIS